MQIIASFLISLSLLSSALAQLDEVDVIRSEMDKSMEEYTIGSALVLLSSEKDFKVVASKLIDLLNVKYGKEWITLIGTNLHTTIVGLKMVRNTTLLLEYKSTHVMIVKQELEHAENTNQTSLESIIERAKVATVQQISTSNSVNFNRFSQLAKSVISRDYKSCDKRTESIDIKNWCYRLMSESMVDSINGLFNGTSTSAYSATVGNNNRCFSNTLGLNITEAHVFNLADIYFEIQGFKI